MIAPTSSSQYVLNSTPQIPSLHDLIVKRDLLALQSLLNSNPKYLFENHIYQQSIIDKLVEAHDFEVLKIVIECVTQDIYPRIIFSAIKIKSISALKAIIEMIETKEIDQKKEKYFYFKTPVHNIYAMVLNTWDKEMINYFISLTGLEIFKCRGSNYYSNLIKVYQDKKFDILSELLNLIPNSINDLKAELEELFLFVSYADDVEPLKILMKWGIDINAKMVNRNKSLSIDFFSNQFSYRCNKVRAFLLEEKPIVLDENGYPAGNILYHAIKNNLIDLARYILNHEISLDYLYKDEITCAFRNDFPDVKLLLVRNLVSKYKITEESAECSIKNLIESKLHHNEKLALFKLISMGFKLCNKGICETSEYFGEVNYFSSKLIKVHPQIFCSLREQVFIHLLGRINPLLNTIPEFVRSISNDLMSLPSVGCIKIYLLAMQTFKHKIFPDSGIVKRVALLSEKPFPDKKAFSSLSEDECLAWLEYGAILRSRKALNLIYSILKQKKILPKLLGPLMKGLASIGIAHLNQFGKEWIIHRLVELLNLAEKRELKTDIIRALWAVDKNRKNHFIRDILLEELKQCKEESSYLYEIIEILANYDHSPDFSFVFLLQARLQSHASLMLKRQIALALSKIGHKDGLLTALQLIQNQSFYSNAKDFAMHHQIKKGDVFQMLYVPSEWHQNKKALIENIQDQLVELYYDLPDFQKQLDAALENYKLNPDLYPEVQYFHSHYHTGNRQAIGAPIFFPKHSHLIRVNGTRKGLKLFNQSISETIRMGSGKCDLTLQGVDVCTASWTKIGDAFATEGPDLYFKQHTNAYLTGENSLIMVFSADYYNQCQRRGESRIEFEGALNPVFYGGFPKSIIEKVYLHKKFEHDFVLLYSQESLSEIKNKLNSGLFDQLDLKELKQLRRHLALKEETNGKDLSFMEKITFYEDLTILKERLKNESVFATRDETYETSLRRVMARQILEEYLSMPKFSFTCQDELIKMKDEAFKECLPNFMEKLDIDLLSLPEHALEKSEARLSQLDTSKFDQWPEVKASMRWALLYLNLYTKEEGWDSLVKIAIRTQTKLRFLGLTNSEILFGLLHQRYMRDIPPEERKENYEIKFREILTKYVSRSGVKGFEIDHFYEAMNTLNELFKD